MEQTLKRRIAGGAAGLALLAGAAGAAFADSSGGSGSGRGYGRDAFLDGVAKRLNVSPDRLRDAIEAEAKEHGGPPLLRPGRPPGPPGPIMAGLDAAAKYLGLSDAQLRKELESGKSLAEIADARNKPVAGLKSAIEAAVTADLHDRLDEIVNRKMRTWHHGRRHP